MSEGREQRERRFQFSLQRLAGSFVFFAIALGVWRIDMPDYVADIPFMGVILIASMTACGAAIETILGRRRKGALVGLILAIGICDFVFLMFATGIWSF